MVRSSHPAQQRLRLVVQRILWRGESFYVVLQGRPTSEVPAEEQARHAVNPEGLVFAVGTLATVRQYDELELTGGWETSKKHESRQFRFVQAELVAPQDERGMVDWLASALPYVGPQRAKLLIVRWGRGSAGLDGVWQAIRDPEAIREALPQLTPEACQQIAAVAQGQATTAKDLAWLRGLGLGEKTAAAVLCRYGVQVRDVLTRDPYVLMEEVDRFGFRRTDDVARALGCPQDHPGRARAGILYCLQLAAEEGHTWLPYSVPGKREDDPARGLLERTKKLELDGALVRRVLHELNDATRAHLEELLTLDEETEGAKKKVRVIVDGRGLGAQVALLNLWQAERSCAARLREMLGYC